MYKWKLTTNTAKLQINLTNKQLTFWTAYKKNVGKKSCFAPRVVIDMVSEDYFVWARTKWRVGEPIQNYRGENKMTKSEKKFETKGFPKNEYSPLLLKQTRIITWQERILHMVILKHLKGQMFWILFFWRPQKSRRQKIWDVKDDFKL